MKPRPPPPRPGCWYTLNSMFERLEAVAPVLVTWVGLAGLPFLECKDDSLRVANRKYRLRGTWEEALAELRALDAEKRLGADRR